MGMMDGLLRTPVGDEDGYFKSNPHVGGMADFQSGKIVLNPYSKLSDDEKNAVAMNEWARLLMRQNKITPNFEITPAQQKAFGSYGGGDPLAIKETIVGRIVSGDPSALDATPQQHQIAEQIKKLMQYNYQPQGFMSP